jgi:hypothetical protein
MSNVRMVSEKYIKRDGKRRLEEEGGVRSEILS